MTTQAIHAHLTVRAGAMRDEYLRLTRERIPFVRAMPEAMLARSAEALFATFLDSLAASDTAPILAWARDTLKVRVEQGLPLDGALAVATQFRRAILLTMAGLPPEDLAGVPEVLLFVDDVCEAFISHATDIYMEALRVLSTPLIPVSDGVVVMPLIGAIDRQRTDRLQQVLLDGVASEGARVAILDVTGVSNVGVSVAAALLSAAAAARLLGAEVVLTGMKPAAARALVEVGADLGGVVTKATLKDGIAFALAIDRRGARGR